MDVSAAQTTGLGGIVTAAQYPAGVDTRILSVAGGSVQLPMILQDSVISTTVTTTTIQSTN